MISYLSQNSQLSILVIKKISAPETNNKKKQKKICYTHLKKNLCNLPTSLVQFYDHFC